MQDNGVNRVFFQKEGCIFKADKPRAASGFRGGLLTVGPIGISDMPPCIHSDCWKATPMGIYDSTGKLSCADSMAPLIRSQTIKNMHEKYPQRL